MCVAAAAAVPALCTLVLVTLVLLKWGEVGLVEDCNEEVFFLVCRFSVDLLVCGGRDEVFGNFVCKRLLGVAVVPLDVVLGLTGSEGESEIILHKLYDGRYVHFQVER